MRSILSATAMAALVVSAALPAAQPTEATELTRTYDVTLVSDRSGG